MQQVLHHLTKVLIMSDPATEPFSLILALLISGVFGDLIVPHIECGTQFLLALTCSTAKKSVFSRKKELFQTHCNILFQSEKLLMWGLENAGYMPYCLYNFYWKVIEHGYLTILQSAFKGEINNCNFRHSGNFHRSGNFDFFEFMRFIYKSAVSCQQLDVLQWILLENYQVGINVKWLFMQYANELDLKAVKWLYANYPDDIDTIYIRALLSWHRYSYGGHDFYTWFSETFPLE